MNVSGPSRLRGPRPVPSSRERDNYEDLTRMIAELGLSDVERLQSLYDHRERRGKGPSDREVAFILLMQNARELAEFNADLALAQRLAVDGDEEPDPTARSGCILWNSPKLTLLSRPTPAVALQRDIEKYAREYNAPLEFLTITLELDQRCKHGVNCLTPFF